MRLRAHVRSAVAWPIWRTIIPCATIVTVAASVFFSGKALQSSTEQNYLAQQTAITERYTAAVELLGSDSESARVGGIYSLMSIADESKERTAPAHALLSSFIKSFPPTDIADRLDKYEIKACPSHLLRNGDIPRDRKVPQPRYEAPRELEAAARVLGTRPSWLASGGVLGADFTQTCLVGVDLSGADLRGANFKGSTINEVDFTGADLTGAQFFLPGSYSWDPSGQQFYLPIFDSAKLDSIDFTSDSGYQFYNLSTNGTTFRNSNFDGVDFGIRTNADGMPVPLSPIVNDKPPAAKFLFKEANLSNASFVGANLVGADLSAAHNLDDANLEGVYYNDSTVWPEGFQPPKSADCYLVNQFTCIDYK